MFCPKCGAQNSDGTHFCQACGAEVGSAAGLSHPNQPPVQGRPPVQGQPPRRKSRTGCLIFLVLLLAVAAGIVWFLGSVSLFKPKDLGVQYEKSDFSGVLQKIGTQVDAQLRPEDLGESLNDVKAAGGKEVTENGKAYIQMDNDVLIAMFGNHDKVPKLNPSDYEWTFSDFQQKVFKISGNEASAFFNDTAPAFWWFRQTQIKVVAGNIITSSQLDIAGLTKTLYPDVANKIPIPLPERANLYTEGKISILDNHITMKPDVFNIGPVALPEQFKTEEATTVVASYLDRIITMIPGLVINRIEETGGDFDVDALIPQKVTIRPK